MSNKLFVGNFVFSTTEEDLRDLFSEFGTVTDVLLINDRETGRSRGFGFVTMSTPEEAQAAVEGVDGKEVEGRNLAVNEARPQEQRAPRQFGGGGGGGGGYGGGGGGGYGGGGGGYGGGRGGGKGGKGGFKRGGKGGRGGGGGYGGGGGKRGGKRGGWDSGGGGGGGYDEGGWQ